MTKELGEDIFNHASEPAAINALILERTGEVVFGQARKIIVPGPFHGIKIARQFVERGTGGKERSGAVSRAAETKEPHAASCDDVAHDVQGLLKRGRLTLVGAHRLQR